MKILKWFVVILMIAVLMPSCGKKQPADLVLTGGKIATVDANFSFAEAIAISGGKFIYVGTDRGVKKYIGDSTRVIELGGKLVVPGLIDGHCHMLSLGTSLDNIDLVGTKSYTEIIDKVAEWAKTAKPGEWIFGRGWDQNDWDVMEFPVHDALSKASPNNPVWLIRIDGHAGLANAKALEIAGITARTQDPSGGKILRKSNGQPTGVFIDNAMALVESKIPPLTGEQQRKALEKASDACLSAGLTGVYDAGETTDIINDYKYLADNQLLGVRVYAMLLDPGTDNLEEFLKANKLLNYGDTHLTVRSVKLLIDGALGSRGAALFEPYSDDPKNSGLLTTSPERVLFVSKAALKTGFQVCTHAIGDRGNRLTLDAYEAALKETPTQDHRFRIEHAQIVSLSDIPRFPALGVIPSMQATHATSDMPWAEARVGPERIKGAYAWQKFIQAGCKIIGGSDFPVESYNPLTGFYAGITRQDANGKPEGGWMPEERLTREQALRSYTIWAAYGAFQEDILGSIEAGKLADLVVLDTDILNVPEKEILKAKPVYTIVGGIIKYSTQK